MGALFKKTHKDKPLSNINKMWSCIKDNIHHIIEDNVPTKMTGSKVYQPWITTETKRLIKNKNKWYIKAKQRNNDQAWRKYKDYKKKVQKISRKSHDAHVQNLITEDKSTKKFWKYVDSK